MYFKHKIIIIESSATFLERKKITANIIIQRRVTAKRIFNGNILVNTVPCKKTQYRYPDITRIYSFTGTYIFIIYDILTTHK